MRTESNIEYNTKSTHPGHNFQDFIQQHRTATLLLTISIVAIFIIILFLIIRQPENEDSYREPENAPYVSFEHAYLIEYPAQDSLSEEILFELKLILLNADELASAPTNNSGKRDYIASIDEDSYSVSEINTIDNSELYTMNIDISDGRKYILYLLINNEYHNEYAVAILDRIDSSDTQDYIITFTSNTSEYYSTLGTENSPENSETTSANVDHITGAPVNPIPNSAKNWINTLNLSNPQTIYSTLPSLR